MLEWMSCSCKTECVVGHKVHFFFSSMASMIRKQQVRFLTDDIRQAKTVRSKTDKSNAFRLPNNEDQADVRLGSEMSCCGMYFSKATGKKVDIKTEIKMDGRRPSYRGERSLNAAVKCDSPQNTESTIPRIDRFKSKVDFSNDVFTRRSPTVARRKSPSNVPLSPINKKEQNCILSDDSPSESTSPVEGTEHKL